VSTRHLFSANDRQTLTGKPHFDLPLDSRVYRRFTSWCFM